MFACNARNFRNFTQFRSSQLIGSFHINAIIRNFCISHFFHPRHFNSTPISLFAMILLPWIEIKCLFLCFYVKEGYGILSKLNWFALNLNLYNYVNFSSFSSNFLSTKEEKYTQKTFKLKSKRFFKWFIEHHSISRGSSLHRVEPEITINHSLAL